MNVTGLVHTIRVARKMAHLAVSSLRTTVGSLGGGRVVGRKGPRGSECMNTFIFAYASAMLQ